jgi:transposase
MKAYPLELRQRIVEAVDRQVDTIEQIAEIFRVTQRYVYKLLAIRRETGDLTPRPHGGGATAKLDERQLGKLADLVKAQPDATLAELGQKLNRRQRQPVSLSTICRGLQKLGLTRKKSLGEPVKPIPERGRRLSANRRSCRPSRWRGSAWWGRGRARFGRRI